MLILAALFISAVNSPRGEWPAKELRVSQIRQRVRFEPMGLPEDWKPEKVFLNWIPRMDAFPALPPRQVLTLVYVAQDGTPFYIVQTPKIKGVPPQRNIEQAVGQGFVPDVRRILGVGAWTTAEESGGVTYALIGNGLSAETRWKALQALVPGAFQKADGNKRAP